MEESRRRVTFLDAADKEVRCISVFQKLPAQAGILSEVKFDGSKTVRWQFGISCHRSSIA